MDERTLLGLMLDEALEKVKKTGDSAIVEWTRSPKNAQEAGQARVVRVKDGRITAALFPNALKEPDR